MTCLRLSDAGSQGKGASNCADGAAGAMLESVDTDRKRPPAVCRLCGTGRADAGEAALAWANERDADGRERWLCPDCARRHLRDIEADLPLDLW